ncbi:heterokaryon incompatibility protein-domain-containing protein [Cladorrhinum sp. PSN259]|nr:heterokaryon incompatibility protein-domain-containing protein [Cladorrhinum sp. PSN259]
MDTECWNQLCARVFWHQDLPRTWKPNRSLSALINPQDILSSRSPRDSLIKVLDAAPYPNGPLKHCEIRILTLQPGTWSSPIVCTLENINLQSAVTENGGFCALSYTWGPPAQRRYAIWINGGITTVGEQLFEALAHLRDSHESKRFWIDAICIRQDSNQEKSTQLPLMADIYSSASDVCIWLGPDQDESGYALAAIRDGYAGDKIGDTTVPPQRLVRALTIMLGRQWFSRLWIIQELALASCNAGPRVVTGFEEARWSEFYEYLGTARKNINWSSKKEEYVYADFLKCMDDSPLVGLNTIRAHVQECGSLPLLLALLSTKFAQATDPRDKIYGLFGLLESVERDELAPNYAKTMGEVYKDATASVLRRNGDRLRYLTYPTIPWSASASTPSWVWDLSYSTKHYAFSLSGALIGSNEKRPDHILTIENGDVLTTDATVIDVVVETLPIPSSTTPAVADIMGLYKRAQDAASWWADGRGGIDPLWRSLRGEGNNCPPAKQAGAPSMLPEHWEIELLRMEDLLSACLDSSMKPRPDSPKLQSWYELQVELLYEGLDHAHKALFCGSGKDPYFFATESGLCGWCPQEPSMTSPDYKFVVVMLFRGSGTEIAFMMREHSDGLYTIICPATVSTNWVRLCEAKGNLEPKVIRIK